MRLVLIETENDTTKETLLPKRGTFTIGREGDVVPQLAASKLMSRIHATVVDLGDGTWRIIDGDGVLPSQNGLWVDSERKETVIISEPGQMIDLLPSLPISLMVRVASKNDVLYGRDTAGIDRHAIEAIYDELEDIKNWQREQTKRTEKLDTRLSELAISHDKFSEINTKIDGVLASVKIIAEENDNQDTMIRRSQYLTRGIAVIVAIMLISATADQKHRNEYIQIAASIAVTGLAGAVTMSGTAKKNTPT
jgi:pSer/pThr/pTyr-binding forkhead associated (FHA) protein